MAKRAQGFGMRVRGLDPKVTERPSYVFSLDKPERLMELLPEADVVVLACPLTPETTGLIGAKQLQVMKRSAYLINIGRGKLVTTDDLVQAIKQQTIAGAGLDVVDPEPLPASHELWT